MICWDTSTYGWVYGWVNGWAHVKTTKNQNKSWPNQDNSIMDILDILLKPPQPFIGLFFLFVLVNQFLTYGPIE